MQPASLDHTNESVIFWRLENRMQTRWGKIKVRHEQDLKANMTLGSSGFRHFNGKLSFIKIQLRVHRGIQSGTFLLPYVSFGANVLILAVDDDGVLTFSPGSIVFPATRLSTFSGIKKSGNENLVLNQVRK